ncbi:hypothetical protein Y1Q_0002802 [Alligator mississippiensis]|uniref:Uncharacterized protein n=1 Tax=Alligator mississippiensis TaxID=8496 RepID=A0A151NZ74_ALLMI|nr:hypothetical protein Y1Q_0002802 [Alligator mississippiensis]
MFWDLAGSDELGQHVVREQCVDLPPSRTDHAGPSHWTEEWTGFTKEDDQQGCSWGPWACLVEWDQEMQDPSTPYQAVISWMGTQDL